MKLMPRYNFAIRYFMVFSAIIGVLLLVVLNAIAISGEKDNPRSGNAIGIIQDEYKKPLWIVSGNWLNNLSNQTQTTNNSVVWICIFLNPFPILLSKNVPIDVL